MFLLVKGIEPDYIVYIYNKMESSNKFTDYLEVDKGSPVLRRTETKEDHMSADRYYATISKAEDESYYKKFLLLASFIHVLLIATFYVIIILVYFTHLDPKDTNKSRLNIKFFELEYKDTIYDLFDFTIECNEYTDEISEGKKPDHPLVSEILDSYDVKCHQFSVLKVFNVIVSILIFMNIVSNCI